MKIIFIDGDCLFCHSLVQSLTRYTKGQFFFAKLQGDFAQKNLPQKYIKDLNSVVFLENSIIHTKSSALRAIALNLKFPYNLLGYLFTIIPAFILDFFYNFVAKRRSSISKKYCENINIRKDQFID